MCYINYTGYKVMETNTCEGKINIRPMKYAICSSLTRSSENFYKQINS